MKRFRRAICCGLFLTMVLSNLAPVVKTEDNTYSVTAADYYGNGREWGGF